MASKKMKYTIDFQLNVTDAKQQLNTLKQSLDKMSLMPADPMKTLTPSLQQASQAATTLKKHLDAATNVNTGKLDLSKFSIGLKAAGMDMKSLASSLVNGGQQGTQAFLQLQNAILNSQNSTKRLDFMMSKLGKTLSSNIRWQLSSAAIQAVTSSISSAVHFSKELNKNLTDIRIVTGDSAEQMEKFANQANKTAKAIGSTTNEIIKANLIYRQQGDSLELAAKKGELTAKAANVAFDVSSKEMSEYLTAIWNSYKVGSNELEIFVDKLAKVGAMTATDMAEVSTAMQKVAATANAVGVSYDQLLSTVATVSSATRLSAETVGTAFKTIYARMGDLKLNGSLVEDGLTVKLGTVSSTLKQVGVNVLDSSGNLRDMGLVVEEVGNKWSTLTKAEQAALAEALAGKRQYTQLFALFENWDEYKNTLEEVSTAQGTLNEQNEIAMDSMEGALKRLKTAGEANVMNIVDSDAIITAVNAIASLAEWFDKFTDSVGGFGNLLKGIGGVLVSYFSPQISQGLATGFLTVRDILRGGTYEANQFRSKIDEIFNEMKEKASFGANDALRNGLDLLETYKNKLLDIQNLAKKNPNQAESVKNQVDKIYDDTSQRLQLATEHADGLRGQKQQTETSIVKRMAKGVDLDTRVDLTKYTKSKLTGRYTNPTSVSMREFLDNPNAQFNRKNGVEAGILDKMLKDPSLFAKNASKDTAEYVGVSRELHDVVKDMDHIVERAKQRMDQLVSGEGTVKPGIVKDSPGIVKGTVVGLESSTEEIEKINDLREKGNETDISGWKKVKGAISAATSSSKEFAKTHNISGQSITQMAGAYMSLSSATTMATEAVKKFGEEGVSASEAIDSALQQLPMIILLVAQGFNTLKVAMGSVKGAGITTLVIAGIGAIIAAVQYFDQANERMIEHMDTLREKVKESSDRIKEMSAELGETKSKIAALKLNQEDLTLLEQKELDQLIAQNAEREKALELEKEKKDLAEEEVLQEAFNNSTSAFLAIEDFTEDSAKIAALQKRRERERAKANPDQDELESINDDLADLMAENTENKKTIEAVLGDYTYKANTRDEREQELNQVYIKYRDAQIKDKINRNVKGASYEGINQLLNNEFGGIKETLNEETLKAKKEGKEVDFDTIAKSSDFENFKKKLLSLNLITKEESEDMGSLARKIADVRKSYEDSIHTYTTVKDAVTGMVEGFSSLNDGISDLTDTMGNGTFSLNTLGKWLDESLISSKDLIKYLDGTTNSMDLLAIAALNVAGGFGLLDFTDYAETMAGMESANEEWISKIIDTSSIYYQEQETLLDTINTNILNSANEAQEAFLQSWQKTFTSIGKGENNYVANIIAQVAGASMKGQFSKSGKYGLQLDENNNFTGTFVNSDNKTIDVYQELYDQGVRDHKTPTEIKQDIARFYQNMVVDGSAKHNEVLEHQIETQRSLYNKTLEINTKQKKQKEKELVEQEKALKKAVQAEKEAIQALDDLWDKEYLTKLQEVAEKHKEILEQFEEQSKIFSDFAQKLTKDTKTSLSIDLLGQNGQVLQAQGKEIQAQIEYWTNVIPRNADEATERANRLVELHQGLRDNMLSIQDNDIAWGQAIVENLDWIASSTIGEQVEEIKLLNELVNDLDSKKYVSEVTTYGKQALLMMKSQSSTVNQYDRISEKQAENKKIIEFEKQTQERLKQILESARAWREQEAAKEREKEREQADERLQEAKDNIDKVKDKIAELNTDISVLETTMATALTTFNTKLAELSNQRINIPVNFEFNEKKYAQQTNVLSTGYVSNAQDGDKVKHTFGGIIGKTTEIEDIKISQNKDNSNVYDISANSTGAFTTGTVNLHAPVSGEIIFRNDDALEIKAADSKYYIVRNLHHTNSTLKKGDQVYKGSTYIGVMSGLGNETAEIEINDKQTYNYAKGSDSTPAGKAFVGELGQELAILPDGTPVILGQNGIEVANLPAGTKILTAEETEKVLSNVTDLSSLQNNTNIPITSGTRDRSKSQSNEVEKKETLSKLEDKISEQNQIEEKGNKDSLEKLEQYSEDKQKIEDNMHQKSLEENKDNLDKSEGDIKDYSDNVKAIVDGTKTTLPKTDNTDFKLSLDEAVQYWEDNFIDKITIREVAFTDEDFENNLKLVLNHYAEKQFIPDYSAFTTADGKGGIPLEESYAARHIQRGTNCVAYANARASEITGKQIGFYCPDGGARTMGDNSGIKVTDVNRLRRYLFRGSILTMTAGDAINPATNQPYGHAVVVENYDPRTDTLSFSDSFTGTIAKQRKFAEWAKQQGVNGVLPSNQYYQGGLTQDETAWVGELGPELMIHPDGHLEVIGKNGLELAHLPKGAQIINNADMNKLLTNPVNYRGYAEGTWLFGANTGFHKQYLHDEFANIYSGTTGLKPEQFFDEIDDFSVNVENLSEETEIAGDTIHAFALFLEDLTGKKLGGENGNQVTQEMIDEIKSRVSGWDGKILTGTVMKQVFGYQPSKDEIQDPNAKEKQNILLNAKHWEEQQFAHWSELQSNMNSKRNDILTEYDDKIESAPRDDKLLLKEKKADALSKETYEQSLAIRPEILKYIDKYTQQMKDLEAAGLKDTETYKKLEEGLSNLVDYSEELDKNVESYWTRQIDAFKNLKADFEFEGGLLSSTYEEDIFRKMLESGIYTFDQLKEQSKALWNAFKSDAEKAASELDRLYKKQNEFYQYQEKQIKNQLDILKDYDSIMNSIEDTQYEINQLMMEQRITEKYLSEEGRKQLISSEEYLKATQEIQKLEAEIVQANVAAKEKISKLSKDEQWRAESILATFKAQTEEAKKRLEIIKAEMQIQSKANALNSALQEKTVRVFTGGVYRQMANQQSVRDAQKALDDAQHELYNKERDLNQNQEYNEMEEQMRALKDAQTANTEEVKKLRTELEDLFNPVKSLSEIMKAYNTAMQKAQEFKANDRFHDMDPNTTAEETYNKRLYDKRMSAAYETQAQKNLINSAGNFAYAYYKDGTIANAADAKNILDALSKDTTIRKESQKELDPIYKALLEAEEYDAKVASALERMQELSELEYSTGKDMDDERNRIFENIEKWSALSYELMYPILMKGLDSEAIKAAWQENDRELSLNEEKRKGASYLKKKFEGNANWTWDEELRSQLGNYDVDSEEYKELNDALNSSFDDFGAKDGESPLSNETFADNTKTQTEALSTATKQQTTELLGEEGGEQGEGTGLLGGMSKSTNTVVENMKSDTDRIIESQDKTTQAVKDLEMEITQNVSLDIDAHADADDESVAEASPNVYFNGRKVKLQEDQRNARGTKDARAGISRINELGVEMLSTRDGQFIELNPHEKIFNNDQMNYLYDLSRRRNAEFSSMASSMNYNNLNENFTIQQLAVTLENVQDPESFITGLKSLQQQLKNNKFKDRRHSY